MLKTLFFSILLSVHPVHVTLTSIDYIPEINSFNVFIRMYVDDFLLDCKLSGIDIQNKDFSGNNSLSDDVMEKYLNEKIVIKVNADRLTGKLKDMNVADNEVSMNLEYPTGKKPKTLTVKNLIMTDLHNDQSNMLIVRVNDFEEGIKMTSDLTEQTFKIK